MAGEYAEGRGERAPGGVRGAPGGGWLPAAGAGPPAAGRAEKSGSGAHLRTLSAQSSKRSSCGHARTGRGRHSQQWAGILRRGVRSCPASGCPRFAAAGTCAGARRALAAQAARRGGRERREEIARPAQLARRPGRSQEAHLRLVLEGGVGPAGVEVLLEERGDGARPLDDLEAQVRGQGADGCALADARGAWAGGRSSAGKGQAAGCEGLGGGGRCGV